MKNNFYSLKIFFALLAILITAHFVSAVFVPGPVTPPTNTPQPFLDVSSTGQTKQGWLRLGGSGAPGATLDVVGTTISNTLGVVGDSWVSGKLRVGGITIPAATDPTLVVTGGYIRSSIATGTGMRPACFDSNGLIKPCSTGPITQCNDGIDNTDPEDTLVDIADPGCLSGVGGAYNSADNDETNTAVASTCGSASSTTPVSTAPTTNLCASGNTASSVTSNTSSYNWTCTNGTNPSIACSVPKNSIVWNSSSCTGYADIYSSASTWYPFSATCSNATNNGTNITTWEKEVNGVVSPVTDYFVGSSTINLAKATGGNANPSTEVIWSNGPNNNSNVSYGYNNTGMGAVTYPVGTLKTFRVRPVSGTTTGPWSKYWTALRPDDIPVNTTVKNSSFSGGDKKLTFTWPIPTNENSSPKVISYQIRACLFPLPGNGGGIYDCVPIGSFFESINPGTTSVSYIDTGTYLGGSAYVKLINSGTPSIPDFTCEYHYASGSTQSCEFFIRGFIDTTSRPEFINGFNSSTTTLDDYTFSSRWTKF